MDEILYAINDALSALAAEFGAELSDEELNSLVHHVANAFGMVTE